MSKSMLSIAVDAQVAKEVAAASGHVPYRLSLKAISGTYERLIPVNYMLTVAGALARSGLSATSLVLADIAVNGEVQS